jgi:hypothetical protein
MDALDALRMHALVGIPVGLVTGLLLGLVARHQGGWGGYASERRRAARLSHISLVMLPVISGLYGLWLSGAPRTDLVAWGARLFIPGSVALSAALAILAARPSWKAVLPLPAMTVVAGSIVFAFAGLLR